MTSLKQINKIIQSTVSENLELMRGEGYHYFVYDDLENNGVYEQATVMEPYTSHISVDEWLDMAMGVVDQSGELKEQG